MSIEDRLTLATRMRIEAHQKEQERYAQTMKRMRSERSDRSIRAFIFAGAFLALASFLGLLMIAGGR